MSKTQAERPEAGEDKLTGLSEKAEKIDQGEKAEGSVSTEEPKRPTSGGGDLTIYLFGRTGREKEEWFRRFLLASRMKSEGRGSSLPGICKSGELCTLPGYPSCLLFPHTYHLHRRTPLPAFRIAFLWSM